MANAFELEELIEETYGQTIDPFSYYLKSKIRDAGRHDFGIEEHLLRKVRKLSDVGAGESVEEVMLHVLARRLKKPESELKSPLHTLRFKSLSALGFSMHFINNVSKIR